MSSSPSTPGLRTAIAPLAQEDPWRERIATLEVQLSAARASSSRASSDVIAMRERLDAMLARLESVDEHVRASMERVERTARDARDAAERPVPLEDLRARMGEIETIAQAARAASAAFRQEIAENRRLDEARAVRLQSIEGRVGRIEIDPRAEQLRLAIDRIDARMLGIERDQEILRSKVDASEARAKDDIARFGSAIENVEKLTARLEELAEAQDALRESANVDILLPRLADLETLVIENGRNNGRLAKQLDELRDALAIQTAAMQAAAHVAAAQAEATQVATPTAKATRAKSGFGVTGIGPKIESKLRDAGVPDAAALAALDDAQRASIAVAIGVKREKLDAWCEAARSR